MLDGLSCITRQSNINRMDKNLPVFFIAGDRDPVGGMGKGVGAGGGERLVICAEGQIIGLGAVGDLAQALNLVVRYQLAAGDDGGGLVARSQGFSG